MNEILDAMLLEISLMLTGEMGDINLNEIRQDYE